MKHVPLALLLLLAPAGVMAAELGSAEGYGLLRRTLPRVPGHLAYWFGWYSFFPQSELYTGPPLPPGGGR